MAAERDIAEEGQILHSYGRLSDAQLLQIYGFVPVLPEGVSNPDNSLPLSAADVIACCQRPVSQVNFPCPLSSMFDTCLCAVLIAWCQILALCAPICGLSATCLCEMVTACILRHSVLRGSACLPAA